LQSYKPNSRQILQHPRENFASYHATLYLKCNQLANVHLPSSYRDEKHN
jgi:hypothetical protein